MNTDEKVNDQQKERQGNIDLPFGDFQKMHQMMNNCCRNDAIPSDCCSMLAKMKGSDKARGKDQEQATAASNEQ